MAISNNFSGLLSGLSFTGNISKLRKAIMEFFESEGIACEIKDGDLLLQFNDSVYTLLFGIGNEYAECGIVYECNAEEYVNMEQHDKTFLADKVNTELENHATVYAFNDSFKVTSTFYFTSKKMLVDLFIKHFNELNESVGMALDIVRDKIAEAAEDEKPKQIGFCVQESTAVEKEDVKISAKKQSV